MRLKIIHTFFWCCLTLATVAQIPDSVVQKQPDTLSTTDTAAMPAIQKKNGLWYRIWKKDYPNPKKALYLALVFPGGGQIYNKRWWKLPLVYGGLTLSALAIDFNVKRYKIFRDAYIAELAGEEHRFTGTGLDAGDLRRFRDFYDKNRQLSYIGFVAVYLVQGAEAFVDAHLRTFDVSEDLSLKIRPVLQSSPGAYPAPGLGLSLQIGHVRTPSKPFLIIP
ncbi:MAG: hypothetical protein D6714_14855 [Bacteroidetes bacterium]|nr:MAG: hypothetical protein D6714_14855 [Bacteroidota bacterium]